MIKSRTSNIKKITIRDKRFNSVYDFVRYLSSNFSFGLDLLASGELLDFIEKTDELVFEKINSLTKNFQYPENILTVIIYLLNNNIGIVTSSNIFDDNYSISNEMQRIYPKINEEIRRIFYDNTLSVIYLDKYEKTGEQRYKRYFSLMKNIEQNSQYTFSYYYFLFIHLPNDKIVNFHFHDKKFSSLGELADYLFSNKSMVQSIILELMDDHIIMGLYASNINLGITNVVHAKSTNNYLDMLRLVQKTTDSDIKELLYQKMSIWLLKNYKSYNFTDSAKSIQLAYDDVIYDDKMNFEELVSVSKIADKLFEDFKVAYVHNKIIKRKSFITASSDAFYLSYMYNSDLVCQQFLLDNEIFDDQIFTSCYALETERQILIDELNNEVNDVLNFEKSLGNYLNYSDEKKVLKLSRIKSTLIFNFILCLILYVCNNFITYTSIEQLINLGIISFNVVFILFVMFFVLKQFKFFSNVYDLKEEINISYEIFEKEKNEVLVVDFDNKKYFSLASLKELKDNRNRILSKYSNFVSKKVYNLDLIIKLTLILMILPILINVNYIFEFMLEKSFIYPIYGDFSIIYSGMFVVGSAIVLFSKKYIRNYNIIIILFLLISILLNYFIF